MVVLVIKVPSFHRHGTYQGQRREPLDQVKDDAVVLRVRNPSRAGTTHDRRVALQVVEHPEEMERVNVHRRAQCLPDEGAEDERYSELRREEAVARPCVFVHIPFREVHKVVFSDDLLLARMTYQ